MKIVVGMIFGFLVFIFVISAVFTPSDAERAQARIEAAAEAAKPKTVKPEEYQSESIYGLSTHALPGEAVLEKIYYKNDRELIPWKCFDLHGQKFLIGRAGRLGYMTSVKECP